MRCTNTNCVNGIISGVGMGPYGEDVPDFICGVCRGKGKIRTKRNPLHYKTPEQLLFKIDEFLAIRKYYTKLELANYLGYSQAISLKHLQERKGFSSVFDRCVFTRNRNDIIKLEKEIESLTLKNKELTDNDNHKLLMEVLRELIQAEKKIKALEVKNKELFDVFTDLEAQSDNNTGFFDFKKYVVTRIKPVLRKYKK